MSGILFLILGVTATIVTIWQMGFLSGVLGWPLPPDYALAGFYGSDYILRAVAGR